MAAVMARDSINTVQSRGVTVRLEQSVFQGTHYASVKRSKTTLNNERQMLPQDT